MKQDHQQFKALHFKELPVPLPVGERVIWQGKPTFKGLALRSFHIREVAIYFGLLLAWRLWSTALRPANCPAGYSGLAPTPSVTTPTPSADGGRNG